MSTVPNQKTVKTVKEKSNKQNYYSIFNLEALHNALLELNSNEFKLWCFINKNQDNYTFSLSNVEAQKWGIGSSSSYHRAVKTLIEKGYLVQDEGNHYIFYEKPPIKEEILVTVSKSDKVQSG